MKDGDPHGMLRRISNASNIYPMKSPPHFSE